MIICPICQKSSDVKLQKKHNEYDILFCSECIIQFSHPMENPGKLYYEKCNIYEGRSTYSQLASPDHDWRFQTFFQLLHFSQPCSILDIGCGDGGFLSLANEKGFDAFGLEMDSRAVQIAKNIRKLENIECGDWENLKNTGWKDFDVITLFDVLEHIASPYNLMKIVYNLLKPGGIVCITVPRIDRLPRIFDPVADFPPHHFTLWSLNALQVLLKNTDFKVIDLKEKNLGIDDCLIHLKWRLKRLRKSSGEYISSKQPSKSSHSINDSADIKIRKKSHFTKRSIFFIMMGLNRILRPLHIGKGQTILAIAKKDSF